jgi:hypothetical protein
MSRVAEPAADEVVAQARHEGMDLTEDEARSLLPAIRRHRAMAQIARRIDRMEIDLPAIVEGRSPADAADPGRR